MTGAAEVEETHGSEVVIPNKTPKTPQDVAAVFGADGSRRYRALGHQTCRVVAVGGCELGW